VQEGLVSLQMDTEKTADYRIGNWIFELNDLQEEGLDTKRADSRRSISCFIHISEMRGRMPWIRTS
jgi:hypothetical protein